ncbi:MAG: hypothetical protein HJJLKODD_00522 [Phycisphaerae bacterium]|nr:hypothetical protein [Phycisphaerae bacterium]
MRCIITTTLHAALHRLWFMVGCGLLMISGAALGQEEPTPPPATSAPVEEATTAELPPPITSAPTENVVSTGLPEPDDGLTAEERDFLRKPIRSLTPEEKARYIQLAQKKRDYTMHRARSIGESAREQALHPPTTQPTEEPTTTSVPTLSQDNLTLPYDQKQYVFGIKSAPYTELIEAFERQSGLPVLGVSSMTEQPVTGTLTYFTPTPADFRTTLHQINDLLWFQCQPPLYLYLRRDEADPKNNRLELYKFAEFRIKLPPDRVFINIPAMRAADLSGSDIVRLFFAPQDPADMKVYNELVSLMFGETIYTEALQDSGYIDATSRIDVLETMLEYIEKFRVIYSATSNIDRLPVVHIKASEALEQLNLLDDKIEGEAVQEEGTRRPSRPRPAESRNNELTQESQKVVIIADDKNKSLIVSGLPYKIKEIKDLLAVIDIPKAGEEQPPVVLRLQHAPAVDAADIVNQVFGGAAAAPKRGRPRPQPEGGAAAGGEGDFTCLPEERTNALIMLGDAEIISEAVAFVKEYVDLPEESSFRRIVVEHRTPEEIVNAVSSMMGPTRGKPDEQKFSINASDNAVIITGEPSEMSRAAELIKQLDIPDSDPATVYSVKLERAQPTFVADLLRQKLTLNAGEGGPAPRSGRRAASGPRAGDPIYADDANGVIYFTGTKRQWEQELLPIIQKVDREAVINETVGEYIALKYIDAATAIEALNTAQGNSGRARPNAEVEGPRFAPLAAGILVAGEVTPQEMKQIRATLEQIDIDPDASKNLIRKTFMLTNADPADVEQSIQQFFGGGGAVRGPRNRRAAAVSEQNDIRITQTANGLIVMTTPEKITQIEALINELDQPGQNETVQMQIFPVKNASPEELTPVLTALLQNKMEEKNEGGAQPRGRAAAANLTVEPDTRMNSIIVSGPQSIVDYAAEVLVQLDQPKDQTQKFSAYYQCVNSSAGELATMLSSMFGGTAVGGGSAPAGGDQANAARRTKMRQMLQAGRSGSGEVEIYALPGDKALSITTRSEAQLAEVLDKARQIDEMAVATEPIQKRFTLEHCDVYDMADDLIEMFGDAKGGRTPARAAATPVTAEGEDSWDLGGWDWGSSIDTGPRISGSLRIKPLEESSTLVVVALPTTMIAIEDYIGEMEQIEDLVASKTIKISDKADPFRIYTPEHLSASDLVDNAENLFDKIFKDTPPVSLDVFSQDEVVMTGNQRSFDDVEALIRKFVDIPDAVGSRTVMKIKKLPSNVPSNMFLSALRTYMPEKELDIEDLTQEGDSAANGMNVQEIK